MFAAFIILPTRFWPRNDRELPFLAIALKNIVKRHDKQINIYVRTSITYWYVPAHRHASKRNGEYETL